MTIYRVEIDGVQHNIEGDHPPSEAEARATVAAASATPEAPGAISRFMAPIGDAIAGIAKAPAALMHGASRYMDSLDEASRGNIGPMSDLGTDAAHSVIDPAVDQAKKGGAAFDAGHYSEAAGHGAAALLPVVGPQAAHAGETMGSGNVAGGLGETAVALAPFAPAPKFAEGLAGALDRSSRRSVLNNILQPMTKVEKDAGMRLAGVAQKEGLVPPLSTRASQIVRARRALADARSTADDLTAQGTAAGKTVDASNVLDRTVNNVPPTLPGGAIPRSGRAVRATANGVANDAFDAISAAGNGTTDVPLADAIGERRRLDGLLKAVREAGKDKAPVGTRSIQDAADAWRGAIATSYPELGAANLRQSDFITITKMMERAAKTAERTGGAGSTLAEAGMTAAKGDIPGLASRGARAIITNAPFASLSASGKLLVSKLVSGGPEAAQAWVRAAAGAGLTQPVDDQMNERELNRKAALALRTQATGVVSP